MIARYLELHQYLLTAFADTHHSFMIEGNDIEFRSQLPVCETLQISDIG